jgi:hypothetical protein
MNYYTDSVHVKIVGYRLKVWLVAMFVFIYIQTIFEAWYVDAFMIYFHITFHVSRSMVIIIFKLKSKENSCTGSRFVFYIIQKQQQKNQKVLYVS